MTDNTQHRNDDATAPASGDPAAGGSAQGMIRQQMETRDQIRYVREFMTDPQFIDLAESGVTTSSSQTEIEQRRADLEYKVKVLEAIISIHRHELNALDKFLTQDDAPETPPQE